MKKYQPINYKLLRRQLNPRQLNFKNTDELKPLTGFMGQERALEAIIFGIGIKNQGYNLYAMGPSGIGKRSLIRALLEQKAITQKVPSDWCYINNFENTDKPIALKLPPGMGLELQQDMKNFITELNSTLLTVFESDEYREGLQEIAKEFNRKKGKVSKRNRTGLKNKIPKLYKERHKKEKELQLQFTKSVIEPLILKMKKKYNDLPEVIKYLSSVQDDITNHVNDLVKTEENTDVLFFVADSPLLTGYQINLLIDNSQCKGAPVIFEDNPYYSNLISRVEHTSQFGNLTTNFSLIRPGALHRANGGYLIVEARKILKEEQSWEALKRSLYSKKIIIEPIENIGDSVKPVSLEPAPIPLEVKVILLGKRYHYYHLSHKDPDFGELFKVAVDFDDQINKTENNIQLYGRLIATIAKREGLRPLSANAVAEIIDESSRIAEDIEKLSTHIRAIDDLILEADYWAGTENKTIVEAIDVKKAVEAQIRRLDRSKQLYYEEINRNFVLIATEGKTVGQVNCLSVVRVGKFSYGHPTRVTAKVRMGRGKIIDIQREIKMAGPIHTKACLILGNFLSGKYNLEHSFSLSASLAFEQIYGMIDGDSASVGELCALISCLADVPIRQDLAVTGSINQYGVVQVVGGINEKIEGFFDICQFRKLTGTQGVIIPNGNLDNLMLREKVLLAAKRKHFFIYTIDTVDEAIELLMNKTAGIRGKDGQFPADSINYRVEKQLEKYSMNIIKEKSKFK